MRRWKSVREPGAAKVRSLKLSSLAAWSKRDLECRLDVNRRAVLHRRLKLPLGESLGRIPVQAIIDSSQHSNIPDCTIRSDDRIKNHRSVNVFVHQLQWVCGVDFARGHGLGNIFGWWIRAIGCAIAFGKANDPAPAGRVQVGHVQSHRVELAVAEDGTFGRGEISNALCRHRTSRRSADAGWASTGEKVGINGIGGSAPPRDPRRRIFGSFSNVETCRKIARPLSCRAISVRIAAVACDCTGRA